MRKPVLPVTLSFLASVILLGGFIPDAVQSETKSQQSKARWYSQQQVVNGNALYRVNCAKCHVIDASGQKINDIVVPALNGTEHTWHHPMSVLRRVVRNGGKAVGGIMPGFASKLTSEEIDAILAWAQSHWSDEIYAKWAQIDAKSRNK